MGEERSACCKGRSDVTPPKESEGAQVHVIWRDPSMGPEGNGESGCQAIIHHIWMVMAVWWSSYGWRRGNIIPIFKKIPINENWFIITNTELFRMMLFILDILCYWFLLVIDYYILMYMDKESPKASWV